MRRYYVDFDLCAGAAGVGGADGLVGGEDPHAADAAGLLVALVEGHVVGLLHHELRLPQLHAGEAGGQVSRAAAGDGGGAAGQRRQRADRRRSQQERARGRRSSHVGSTVQRVRRRCIYLRARLRGRSVRTGDGYHGGGARRVRGDGDGGRRVAAPRQDRNRLLASDSKLDGGDLERSPASGIDSSNTHALVD